VEDDHALADALRFSLGVQGWFVHSYTNAEDLLARPLPDGRFCIVCDLLLPGISGLEALQELRRRGVEAPAVLMTTSISRTLRKAATAIGARIVEKPLLGERFLAVVRDLLA
jgi:FixJ family two-component response regulator